jgi:PAS domain S-box-containing protein
MSGEQVTGEATSPEARDVREQAVGAGSEERFRLLVESVKDYAIFMLDPQGVISSWNKGAERIKGYREEEILGEHFSRFYTEPEQVRNHPGHELELAAKNGVYEEEGWRVRKDGSTFWANVVITALYAEDGELTGFAKVTRDMTERRQHEQALAEKAAALERANADLLTQRAELEARNAEQETFVYTVSHDLRAPLLAIQGMSELLATAVRAGDAQEAEFLVGRVNTNVEKMGQLLSDLLKLSRAGRRMEESEALNLSAIAGTVAAELDARLLARQARLSLPKVWPTVLYGRTDAYQVLANLIGNAVKFAGREGELPLVRVSWEHRGAMVAVQVDDNGPGVPAEYREKIFGLFQRLDPNVEGSGVGLAIVTRTVQRYGGEVRVGESNLGGASFTITMPVTNLEGTPVAR